ARAVTGRWVSASPARRRPPDAPSSWRTLPRNTRPTHRSSFPPGSTPPPGKPTEAAPEPSACTAGPPRMYSANPVRPDAYEFPPTHCTYSPQPCRSARPSSSPDRPIAPAQTRPDRDRPTTNTRGGPVVRTKRPTPSARTLLAVIGLGATLTAGGLL